MATREAEKQVDDALKAVGGCGLFQLITSAAFCLLIIPVAFQVLFMYFLGSDSPWKCTQNSTLCTLNGTYDRTNELRCTIPRNDWEFTEPKTFSIVTTFDIYCEKIWLLELCTGIFFLGACIGGVCFGKIADNFGRKIVLLASMVMLLSVAVVSSFVPNIYMFIACRFLIGFFYTPCLGLILVMAMELVPDNRRSFNMNIIWVFYSLAFCLLTLKAYFIKTWRTLLLVSTCPYYIALLCFYQIPESIHWLLLKGKKSQIEKVLEKIANQNKRDISEITSTDYRNTPQESYQKPSSSFKVIFFPMKTAIKTLIQCFTWFTTSMIYYGLSLAASEIGGSMYLNFALVSIMECPGHIFGAFLSNKIGRKKTAFIPIGLTGLLCFTILLVPKNISYLSIILDMFGKLFITMCYSCIYLWSSELYLTNCRGKAIGLFQVFEMLGGAVSPFIITSIASKYITFSIFGACALLGSGLMLTLQETLKKENTVFP